MNLEKWKSMIHSFFNKCNILYQEILIVTGMGNGELGMGNWEWGIGNWELKTHS
jgi:hypothetical protein